jgi:hypothetical protein
MGQSMVLDRAEEHKKLELDRSIKVFHATTTVARPASHTVLQVRRQELSDNLATLSKINIDAMSETEKERYFVKLSEVVSHRGVKFRWFHLCLQVGEADRFRVQTANAEKARKLLERSFLARCCL